MFLKNRNIIPKIKRSKVTDYAALRTGASLTFKIKLYNSFSVFSEIMAVLKANGYGHGSVPMAKFLEAHGFRHFAVATGQEGEEMRRAGVKSNIHVLGRLMGRMCLI